MPAVPVRCSTHGPSVSPKSPPVSSRMRIRPARWPGGQSGSTQDYTPSIAALFCQAFTPPPDSSTKDSSSSRVSVPSLFVPPRSEEEWQRQVAAALEAKEVAALASRKRRVERREEEQRRGGWGLRYTAAERQQMARWRKQRSFVVLVAEERGSGEVLGCAAVSLAQPEAALPPPFPTSKPRRVYVSNIAVAEVWRRQGVATGLLQQCERQARLWRQDSLWLHVELSNKPALALYQRLGYSEVRRDPVFTPNRRCLMRKEVEPLQCSHSSSSSRRGLSSSRGASSSSGMRAVRIASGSNGSGGSGTGIEGSGSSALPDGSSGSRSRSGSGSGVFQWTEVDLEVGEDAPSEQPACSPAQQAAQQQQPSAATSARQQDQ